MATSAPDHETNPFAAAEADREPARRLRGRLAAPVTIVTSGSGEDRTGVTVSSIVVAEGEPPLVYFLLGSATDVFYAIEETRRFVVHVCDAGHREVADVFAGLRPSPGGLFAGRSVTQTEYGPVLDGIGTRAYCSFRGGDEDSYSVIMSGAIDRIELADVEGPLVYFRGRYRALE